MNISVVNRKQSREPKPDIAICSEGCGWRGEACKCEKSEDGNWETACGDMFVFEVGGPVANNCKYCPYCGRLLKEKRWEVPR